MLFDMFVVELEIVTGYLTEYIGLRFLLFFIGEFALVAAFAAIVSVLFLGGWWVLGLSLTANYMNVIGLLVMFGKIMLVSFFIFWICFIYSRFWED